jgi:hypothetical protein
MGSHLVDATSLSRVVSESVIKVRIAQLGL